VVNPELNFLERLACAPSGGHFVHISLQNPLQLLVNPREAHHNRCHHLSPPFLPPLKPNPTPKFYTIPRPRLINIKKENPETVKPRKTRNTCTYYMKWFFFQVFVKMYYRPEGGPCRALRLWVSNSKPCGIHHGFCFSNLVKEIDIRLGQSNVLEMRSQWEMLSPFGNLNSNKHKSFCFFYNHASVLGCVG